ncbi:alpha/beta fold hydrolase [Nocardia brasiliensis]|uniref:Alpha/beta fold hydrolase n=1 Tax=Nocardia brasiliensis TaxID=37326 RepID=A0A6G9XSS1_NOCBR|nr:alpha/beta hydrolase [Nocardia brasiliensis]QIS03946.1 alpha/beta fold hydrolase [Nocardia brasiliensis]
MKSGTLQVPGATLFYEERGSGPLLVLLPGSGADAAMFDHVAQVLVPHFTVLAADPRGYSRSPLDGPPVDQRVEVMSDDIHRLIEDRAPAGESVYVFGASGGAVVALDLLARHPERLALVVAHEPPSFGVLPDAADHRAFVDEVYALFHREGAAVAGAHFAAGVGAQLRGMPDPATLPPRAADMVARVMANLPIMLEHELRQITSYLPDETALTEHADRLVLAVGAESPGTLPYRPATTLAERLGARLVEFPGGHGGLNQHPGPFAQKLLDLLLSARTGPSAT